VPRLRARREDIALLVEHFRREVGARRDLGVEITGGRTRETVFTATAGAGAHRP